MVEINVIDEPSTLGADLEKTITVYENAIGHYAARARRIIGSGDGTIRAIENLVTTAGIQKGFKVLRDRGQMDSTFEALVIRHCDQFSSTAVEAARWRLDNAYNLT